MALLDHWPLFGLRLTTPRLELRYPNDSDFEELAAVAAAGIHDPGTMPFSVAWTDHESPEFERQAMRYWWGCRSNFSVDRWELPLVVSVDGRLAGVQALHTMHFPTLRSIETGSWLGQAFHGQGIGTEMRRAALVLAFDHLGALEVTSEAFLDNVASNRVSQATGYEPDGVETVLRRGERDTLARYRLDIARWPDVRPDFEVTVEGVEPCLSMLGI